MNSRVIKPIIITPEQIMAAATKIAAKDETAWEFTSTQYLKAVRSFLESSIYDLLNDADWHANADNFAAEKFDGTRRTNRVSDLDESSDFDVPEPPEWAHDDVNLATDIVQRRQLTPEPDGDIIYA